MALPVTFVAGDVLEAAQLNSNFTYVEGLGGLTYITQATPSAQTTISINNCFTSAYENYRIVMNVSAFAVADGSVGLRLRVGGVDATTNYVSQRLLGTGATVAAASNVLGTDEMYFLSTSTLNPRTNAVCYDISSPNIATTTAMNGSFGLADAINGVILINSYGAHTTETAYDGFTLIASNNMTGTIRVYGYQNS